MIPLYAAVVIPCLNEAETLSATCSSLGFAPGEPPPQRAVLILVDNGSTDSTFAIAEELKRALPDGAVAVVTESERGYVPPRARGNATAAELAAEQEIALTEVLILQADADTCYRPGYVDAMRHASQVAGPEVMLDGCMAWPPDFAERHLPFLDLCDETDASYQMLLSEQAADDVIFDDKVSAYRLADYYRWGGHHREWETAGDEIHAETTRLYMRARSMGAQRRLCDDALAWHSPRRLLADPAFSFATAGFPRGDRFRSRWMDRYKGPDTIDAFSERASRSLITLAVSARQAHLRGLFHLLPINVVTALGEAKLVCENSAARVAGDILFSGNRQRLTRAPGIFLEEVFARIDEWTGW